MEPKGYYFDWRKQEMKEHKVWNFIKNHKKEIAIAVCVTAAGVVLFAITKKGLTTYKNHEKEGIKILEDLKEAYQMPIEDLPKLDLGEITDLWVENGFTEVVINNITVDDLGAFGKELLKIDNVKGTTVVSGILDLLEKDNDIQILRMGS